MSQENSEQAQLFQAWTAHPVTRALFKKLLAHREFLKENWANGGYTASFEVEMLVKNAGATGACSMIQDILNYDADDLEIEL